MADLPEGQMDGENSAQGMSEPVAGPIEHGHSGHPDDNLSLAEAVVIEQITFNELPPEMISQVFEMLTLVERIPLEAVCSKWQTMIRNIKDQKGIILTNTRTMPPNISYHYNRLYHSSHSWNKRLHKVTVSSTMEISSILKRCPKLIAIKIDFEYDFEFSQQLLASDLSRLCPKLEHLEWFCEGPKKDFLIELGAFDNLSCWMVEIDDEESDEAVRVLARQHNLRLKFLTFGKGISKVLSLTDPTVLEYLFVETQVEEELININKFHHLKVVSSARMSHANYAHLQTLTTLNYIEVYDDEHIFNETILEAILKNNQELEYLFMKLNSNVHGVPLIAKNSPNLRSLAIKSVPPYYRQEDWIAISKLRKLNFLYIRGISSRREDMNGIALVLKNCSSINELRIFTKDDELEEDAIVEIEQNICRVVEQCELKTSRCCFIRKFNIDDNAKDCVLTWRRCALSPFPKKT